MAPTQLNNLDIDVGLLAALPVEASAARQIFDEIYQEGGSHNGNHSQIGISLSGFSFTVGRIGPHNVVLIYLPGMGKTKAASVSSIFAERFSYAKLVLLLGICGASPSPSEGSNIFLGDVIVSAEVLIHDYGKWYQEGFHRVGGFNSSSQQILSFQNKLKSSVQSLEKSVSANLSLFANQGMEFSRPESHHDRLFDKNYIHRHNQLPSEECSGCTKETVCASAKMMSCFKLGCDAKEIIRDASHFPINLSPSLHFGPMASGDAVIKSAQHRDHISGETGAIAFEMESAGLVGIPHFLVIKGVSDYADSHKDDMWKGYAAAASASCVKAVIHLWVSERPGHTDSPPIRNNSSPGYQNSMHNASATHATQVNSSGTINLSMHMDSPSPPTPPRRLLDAPMAKFAHNSNENVNRCHPGTFSNIFQQIFDWIENSMDQRLMWLGGWPGTGKTTLAYSVSVHSRFENYFGASFMFQKSKDGCHSLDRFVGTVTNQLAEKSIDYNNELEIMLSARPSLQDSRFEDQWKYLILHPLSKLPVEKRFLLIIDALDQCDRGEKLLSHLLHCGSNRLRVLVTSRPDIELSKFPSGSYIQIMLHTIPAHMINQDIRVFLLANLRPPINSRLVETDLDSLVDLSHGNFQWAVTASLYLNSHGLYNARMERLLHTGTLEGEEKVLDALYLTIIRDYTSPEKWGQDHSACCDLLRFFLGGIAVLFASLAPRSFYRLVQSNNQDYDIHEILTSMKSLLEFPADQENADTYIRFHHPTFREFLLDHERCVKEPGDLICVNEKASHQTLLSGCLNVLLDEWEFEGPGSQLPNEVKYACLYWAFHLEKSEMFVASNHMIFDLIYDHSLHWIEALGLMKSSNAALGALRVLSMVLRGQEQLELLAFVQDLTKFVQYNQEIIDKDPSQIHSSSLLFAPQQSIVRQHFRDKLFRFVQDIPVTCESWPLFRHLEGHYESIQHLLFANSGGILVSTSSDKTLRIWDSVSGQNLRIIDTLGLVTSMAISRDGKSQFLAALSDGIIEVWNIKTGRVAQTLNTESGYEALIWRKNEAVLLAFRSDDVIEIWDIAMGRCMGRRRWSQDHSSLSFSEDGSTIAAWCSGSMVQVWKSNLRSFSRAAILSQMEGLNCIALSPEGGRLASASKSIHIFDTVTGSKLASLEGHIMNVRSLVFSKRSSVLASGSNDRTVKLWNLDTGQCLRKLEGHRSPIISLAFSYNDETLATGSLENSIYLWSTSAFFDHSSKRHVSDDLKLVTAVACTDNGDAVAIGFSNNEIRLQRTENQDYLILNEHNAQISDLHFIESGASLVSASHDGSIILWDGLSGLLLTKFADYGTAIQKLVFTDDQRALAVVLINFTICVWIDESQARPTLIGHTDYIEMVVFAKRKKLIISSSRDKSIRIWDMMNGKPLMNLVGHQNWVTGLDLASDEECLVSVSLDKTIRLWSTSDGQCSITISNDFQMQSVAISGDKSTLASFYGNQMTLWDTKKSEIRKILRVRSSPKKSLSFSGNYLITEHGSLALDQAVSDDIPLGLLCSAIYVDQAWIFHNGAKFIWIPREYRDLKCVFLRENVVIFVKKTAEILTLKLSLPL